MSKVFYALILLSLSGCITPPKPTCNNATTIVSDRSDIVIVPVITQAQQKFSIKPTKFTRVISNNAAKPSLGYSFFGIEGYEVVNSRVIKPKNAHELWMKQMHYNAKEIANTINGKKKDSFDLMSIPLSFSHRFELDKPRKKANKYQN